MKTPPIHRRLALVLVPAAMAVMTAAANGQTTWYVNGDCGNDAWTGTSSVCSAPNGPKLTIQAGIDVSVNGDTVIVSDGTYMGVGNKNLDYGGRLITLQSENGPTTCIIDCENDGRGVYFHSGETADAVLDGFTIRNGNVVENGGAILCQGARPKILNCVLSNSQALEGGGGMYNGGGSSPTVTNCTFSSNAARYGGGMNNMNSNSTVTNCTFSGNSATSGGAMYNWDNYEGSVTDCTFDGNSAVGGISSGGGMANWGSRVDVTNCTFSGNSSDDLGGGMYTVNIAWCGPGDGTVTNCTFSGNSANNRGGGLYAVSCGPAVTNCILWNNSPDTIAEQNPGSTLVFFAVDVGAWRWNEIGIAGVDAG